MSVAEQVPVVDRVVEASTDAVWAVLADGWLYPVWVVGAARMRDVDESWPAVGAQLHHSVGTWPMLIDDNTEVLEVDPGRLLRLRARSWPAGSAEVLLELEPMGRRTRISMREDAAQGPAILLPRPLRQLAMVPRNKEALRRLAYIAEGR